MVFNFLWNGLYSINIYRELQFVWASQIVPYKLHPMLNFQRFKLPRSCFCYQFSLWLAIFQFPFLLQISKSSEIEQQKWALLSSSLTHCSSSCSSRSLSKRHWLKGKHVSLSPSTPTFSSNSGAGTPERLVTISWRRCRISTLGSSGLSFSFNGLSCL